MHQCTFLQMQPLLGCTCLVPSEGSSPDAPASPFVAPATFSKTNIITIQALAMKHTNFRTSYVLICFV
ncbi:hypothetical protein Hanom_Chr16g01446611 [Helianthus anomalus]